MALGKQIRKYRLAAGLTLDKLADFSGVATGTIGAIEKRDSSRTQYGPALARAFGLTIEQLMDESKDYETQMTLAWLPTSVATAEAESVKTSHKFSPFAEAAARLIDQIPASDERAKGHLFAAVQQLVENWFESQKLPTPSDHDSQKPLALTQPEKAP